SLILLQQFIQTHHSLQPQTEQKTRQQTPLPFPESYCPAAVAAIRRQTSELTILAKSGDQSGPPIPSHDTLLNKLCDSLMSASAEFFG
ncbi:MAG: hypothetical protein ACKPJD_18150, partial [Planctomycetaceae bacterium]